MDEQEIVSFLKQNITPIKDPLYGDLYRCSVCLKSGLTIPNIIFWSGEQYSSLSQERDKNPRIGEDLIKHLLISKNMISSKDISKVEESKNAIPLETLKKIKGESIPSWTGFVVKMNDGKLFNFGTTFSTLFFNFPEGYSGNDICDVISHCYIDANNEIREYKHHRFSDFESITIYHQIDEYSNCCIYDL